MAARKTGPAVKKAGVSETVDRVREFYLDIGNVAREVSGLLPDVKRFLVSGTEAFQAISRQAALRGAKGQQLTLPGVPSAPVKIAEKAIDPAKRLRIYQDRLVKVIDEHEEELKSSLEELGCGGDCYECPNPEVDKYSGVEEQVRGCLRSVVDALRLDPDLTKEPVG